MIQVQTKEERKKATEYTKIRGVAHSALNAFRDLLEEQGKKDVNGNLIAKDPTERRAELDAEASKVAIKLNELCATLGYHGRFTATPSPNPTDNGKAGKATAK